MSVRDKAITFPISSEQKSLCFAHEHYLKPFYISITPQQPLFFSLFLPQHHFFRTTRRQCDFKAETPVRKETAIYITKFRNSEAVIMKNSYRDFGPDEKVSHWIPLTLKI